MRPTVLKRRSAPRRLARWLAGAGLVLALATPLTGLPSPAAASGRPTPDLAASGSAASSPPAGYWLLTDNGAVRAFGHAGSYGSPAGLSLNRAPVCLASTADGRGYWLVAGDGGVFSYGDAAFHGSTGSEHLNRPVIGMSTTAGGKGYWLVASDGGVFSFGDARFYGSTGGRHLNQPVVGMAPAAGGRGYWLVASDGGVFSFGAAPFYGSTGSRHLNAPIVGMAPTPDGKGYWLVARDGGVFSFGDAHFYGSTGGRHLNAPIVGMTPSPYGGYWLAAEDGGIFSFGDAPFFGSLGGSAPTYPVVGVSSPGHAGSCLGTYLPPTIPSPGAGGPAGEGHWTPAARLVGSTAAVYTTVLRPYAGGQPAGVAWIDGTRTSPRLYAGPPSQPPGTYAASGAVAAADRPRLLAAFNSGFQVAQSEGGWYSEGQTPIPLRNGAASLVIYTDGKVRIGQWGRDFGLTPDVASVRQNLTLLVDGARPSPLINDGAAWGPVIGGVGNTWRSGVGVDRYGNLIYVAGPDLFPADLAHLLIAAGATEAMEFDINPMWPVFSTYTTAAGQPPTVLAGQDLIAGMFFGPDHFLTSTDRDFFAIFGDD